MCSVKSENFGRISKGYPRPWELWRQNNIDFLVDFRPSLAGFCENKEPSFSVFKWHFFFWGNSPFFRHTQDISTYQIQLSISSFYPYPLVNIQKAMENHHFEWENSLFLCPFSIAFCMFTRGYMCWIKSQFVPNDSINPIPAWAYPTSLDTQYIAIGYILLNT